RSLRGKTALKVLQRGAAHIRTQHQILSEEQARAGCWLLRPSEWIMGREEREYELADVVHVLSSFAMRAFLEERVSRHKLLSLPLGVSLKAFRPPESVIEARRKRILDGEPLRVLTVGTFCYRKGVLDLAELARSLPRDRFRFRVVGPVDPEARRLQKAL